MNVLKKIQGKKTNSTAIIFIIIQLLESFNIAFLNTNEELIENVLIVCFGTGLFDKVWRNRKDIISWFGKLIKKK